MLTLLQNWLEQPEMAAAVTGAALALLVTWARERLRERRERLNVAAAFVVDLRLHQKMAEHLIAYARKKHIYYWAGFSDGVFVTLLAELAGLSPTAFRCVRQAYGQLKHCNYLTERFRELRHRMSVADALDADNLGVSYEQALLNAQARLGEALQALRSHAPRASYAVELPDVGLTEREREIAG